MKTTASQKVMERRKVPYLSEKSNHVFSVIHSVAYSHKHTHTHTHTYIYIYIYIEREREKYICVRERGKCNEV